MFNNKLPIDKQAKIVTLLKMLKEDNLETVNKYFGPQFTDYNGTLDLTNIKQTKEVEQRFLFDKNDIDEKPNLHTMTFKKMILSLYKVAQGREKVQQSQNMYIPIFTKKETRKI